jgi:hypothetical protein
LRAILGLEQTPRDGGLIDRLRDLDGEQAQAFAAPLAMAAHAQRVGPERMRLGDVLDELECSTI